jgi:hypothetical protein
MQMANFAVLKDNVVTNIIIADTKETAETVTEQTCVEYTESNPAGIGWTYDGTKFIPPVVEAPQDADTEPTA